MTGIHRDSDRPGADQEKKPEAVPDQDKALEAVQSAEALPLDQIIATARHLTSGEIVDAKLTRRNGSLLYRLKVLEATGEVRAFYFFAQSGQLFRIE